VAKALILTQALVLTQALAQALVLTVKALERVLGTPVSYTNKLSCQRRWTLQGFSRRWCRTAEKRGRVQRPVVQLLVLSQEKVGGCTTGSNIHLHPPTCDHPSPQTSHPYFIGFVSNE
jgi:hypothetical protein